MKNLAAILRDGANIAMPDFRQWLGELLGTTQGMATVLATGTVAALVEDRAYATQSALFADLDHAADLFAMVTKDSDPLKNGLYQKIGASGSGSWGTAPLDLFASAAALAANDAVEPLLADVLAARSAVEGIAEPLSALELTLRTGTEVLAGVATTNPGAWGSDQNFGGVTLVMDGADLIGDRLSAVLVGHELELQAGASVTRIPFVLRERTTADSDNADLPGDADSDVIVDSGLFTLASLGLTAGGDKKSATLLYSTGHKISASKTYLLSLTAEDNSSVARVLGFAQGLIAASAPARLRGFYKATAGGAWLSLTSSGPGSTYQVAGCRWLTNTYVDFNALAGRIDDTAAVGASVTNTFGIAHRVAAQRPGDGSFWPLADNHYRWVYQVRTGVAVAAGAPIARAAVRLNMADDVAKTVLRLWARPSDASWAAAAPSVALGDRLITTITKPLAELGIEPTPGAVQRIALPIPPGLFVAGTDIIFDWTTLDADDEVAMSGIERDLTSNSLTQGERGWYDADATLPAGNTIAWELEIEVLDVASAAGLTAPVDPSDQVTGCSATSSGYVVSVTGVLARAGTAFSFGGVVTLDAPAGGSVTGEALTLTYVAPGNAGWPFCQARLAHANISDIAVFDGATELEEGDDFRVVRSQGAFGLSASGSPVNVTVDYDWTEARYDVIWLDPATLALGKTKGADRTRDPGEYLPEAGVGRIPLYHARAAAGSVELVPVWGNRNGVPMAIVAAFEQLMLSNRAALARTLRKLVKGDPLTIAYYGDSQGTYEHVTADWATIDGALRDRAATYLGYGLPSDTVATIRANYNNADGAGGVHTRFGKFWETIRLLQTRYGSTITFRNLGVGGTYSGTETGQGGNASRLAVLTGLAPDVTFLNFGTNEFTIAGIEARMNVILAAIYGIGGDAYVLAPPRPNAAFDVYDEWLATCQALKRAADKRVVTTVDGERFVRTAAFHDTRLFSADETLGGMGLAAIDLASANWWNHDGIHENRVAATFLAAPLL